MIEEELSLTKPKQESVIESKLPKKSRWKTPLFLIILVLSVLIFAPLVYGFANGYFEVSFVNSGDRTNNMKKQEELKSEIAEISRQKEILEQKRNLISEQLKKSKNLVEQSKVSFPEVDAHIQVVSSTCKSCRTPAWIESYRKAFDSLEEIEKIINEDNSNVQIK